MVVIIPSPGIGHLVPMIEFARQITNRDGRLSVMIPIIPAPNMPMVNQYAKSRAKAYGSNNIKFIDLPVIDLPPEDRFRSMEALTSLLVESYKPHVKQAIIDALQAESDSNPVRVNLAALVVDVLCTQMIDVAKELEVPPYLFFTSPAGFLGFMLHLPTLDRESTTTVLGDSSTELVIPSFVSPVPKQVLPVVVLKRKEDGYLWFLEHANRYKETKGIIVNTFYELEPHALNVVSDGRGLPVYPVGPLIDVTGPDDWYEEKASHDTIMKWLDDQPLASVVFLCFGSMGSLAGPQVREVAIGLQQAKVRYLWSLREPPKSLGLSSKYMDLEKEIDGLLERSVGKGLVCGWVPQAAVLAHKAIGGFISHCGWNSILESVWYGVPIATWPIYAEQQMNAFEIVKELELAVGIKIEHRDYNDLITAEEVERAVTRLMNGDDSVRKKAIEMKEKSRKAMMENGSSFTSLAHLIDDIMTNI
ncbi:UDP-glycosyltransferase 43-like [Argentina anserina]|uniref:UDP-glycosyltransferase 43-like n=1 Tax=Argentina anserina TaxID=57926 RepID=UPI0021769194|nr:UDP-glycosyltransferase 43-like [Potentilla anserina]